MSKYKNELPLSGLKVLEFGQIAAGPYTGMLLADLGADVVKVERPNSGDGMRDWPPLLYNKEGDAYSGNFASLNRNKRSITIDLKDENELSKAKQLCSRADVIIENFRPGVMKRMGLDYYSIKKENEKIVYCSISGYGQTGLYANKGAFDVTIQAISGLMSVTGEEDGHPVKCGVPVGDFVTGLYAAYSIMAVYNKAKVTGVGTYIDCSMIGSLLGISALQTSEYYGTKKAPRRLGSAHPRNAPYQGFEAKDRPFVIAAGNEKLWHEVCDIVEKPELKQDERFANQLLRAKNQKKLFEILQPIFLKKNANEWIKKFDKRGVPCAPINNFEEALKDKHVQDMNLIQESILSNGIKSKEVIFPIKMDSFEFGIYRRPPKLGEHNECVFNEWRIERER